MPIFVTYARKDREAVDELSRDLERARNTVWMDNELTGGQVWWDTILTQIRSADLYVFALSPESLKSRACRLELEYALSVKRPLLPVMIRDVAITTAPPAIANTQIVDYRHRTVDAGIALISAVANRPAAPQLPDPLPVPPAPPMSYMNEFRDQVDAPFLTYQQQSHLLVDLKGYLSAEDDDRDTAIELIRALRSRRDIAESIGREIDQLLGGLPPVAAPRPAGSAQPGGFGSPPASSATPPRMGERASAGGPTSPSGPPFTGQSQYPPTPSPYQHPLTPPSTGYQQPPAYQASTYQPIYGGGIQPQPNQTGGQVPPGATVPAHPQATTVLVLGIVSLLVCGFIGIAAGVMGGRVVREIDSQPGRYSGRSQANLGRILGWVGVGLWSLFLLFYALAYAST